MSLRAVRRLVLLASVVLSSVLLGCGSGGAEDSEADPEHVAIESFRYRLTATLEESDRPYHVVQEGEVIRPDREHATLSIAVGPWQHESERLAIGEREWVRGDLPWLDLAASPLAYLGAGGTGFSMDALEGAPSAAETVNSIEVRRYELDEAGLRSLVGEGGPVVMDSGGAFSATVWMDPDRELPVALELLGESPEGYALRVRLEVYDVNDPGITIEEP